MADIAGPYLIGHLLSFTMFGVLCVQIYLYAQAFNKSDPWWIRALVYAVFCIELVFQGLEINLAWWSLGTGWGDPAHIISHSTSSNTLPLLTGIVMSIVHAFYVWRIIVLGKRYLPALLVVILSAGSLAMTIVVTIHLYQNSNKDTLEAVSTTIQVITIYLAFSAAADIVISIAMLVFLIQASRKSQHTETTTRLQKLIKYTVETGVATSCGALTDVILFHSLPNTNWHFVIFLSLSKIYANTLFATLNSRMNLAAAHTRSQLSETPMQFRRDRLRRDFARTGTSEGSTVHISKTTVVLSDPENIDMVPLEAKKHAYDHTSSAGDR